MYERGPYAKGRERREAILRTTLEVFSENGYRGASLRAIARELDISPTLLQHYFSTREGLLTEVVQAWDDENDRRGEGMTFFAHWLTNIKHNVTIPGLIRLYTSFAIEATDPDHSARPFFDQRYAQLTQQVVDDIENQKLNGLAPAEIDSSRVARLLIAACEGLQIRWLHSPDFDMYDEFVFLLREFDLTPPEEEAARAAVLATAAEQLEPGASDLIES
jgi:AcrR family transcriptional regulator